jgi:hypothetical protein
MSIDADTSHVQKVTVTFSQADVAIIPHLALIVEAKPVLR